MVVIHFMHIYFNLMVTLHLIKLLHFLVIIPSMKYHTAGWDSYFAGYVFIRIVHVFATKRHGS